MSKIFNLILYSPSDEFNKMKNILTEYIKTTGIKYFFYCFDNTIAGEYLIEDDVLKIKGIETYIPGILDKTVKAIEIITNNLNYKYDYLLRSNISTIVNIKKLECYLKSNPVKYAGGFIYCLKWLDSHAGIFDNRYKGINFVSGTSIIISYDAVKLLISNKYKINKTIIDDVSIGLFFKENNIMPKIIGDNNSFIWNNKNDNQNAIFYRNKRNDRLLDIYYMKLTVNNIINYQKLYKIFNTTVLFCVLAFFFYYFY
jgi:hypothetical protein